MFLSYGCNLWFVDTIAAVTTRVINKELQNQGSGMLVAQRKLEGLSREERQTLASCEDDIASSFVALGNAIRTIRDRRLYREDFGTFEAYCQERWGWTRQHAYQLMAGAEVAANLASTFVDELPLPTSEGQVRLLTRFEPQEQAGLWKEAVTRSSGRPPTMAMVREVIQERRPVEQVQEPLVKVFEVEAQADILIAFVELATVSFNTEAKRQKWVKAVADADLPKRQDLERASRNLGALARIW